jgi:hypothetical protein
MTTFRHLLLVAAAALVSGCANMSTVFRTFDLEDGKSVTVDAQQRAILVNRVYDGGLLRTVYCAEPSPDSLFAIGASFGSSGSAALASGAKGNADVAQALASAASDALSARNATIQLLRDGLYRACEAFASGALTRLEYAEVTWRYQKMVLAALSIELVANLNRPRREPSVTGASAGGTAPIQGGSPDKAAADEKSTPTDHRAIAAAFQAGAQAGAATVKASVPQVPPYSEGAISRISATAVELVTAVLRSEDRVAQCLRYLAVVGMQSKNAEPKEITSTIERMCSQMITANMAPAAAGGGAELSAR